MVINQHLDFLYKDTITLIKIFYIVGSISLLRQDSFTIF